MTKPTQKNVGRVSLVGAGPGDPGLITAAALARLREADVVVYDALANPALLAEAPRAQLINAGKRARDHTLTQDQINDLLADKALAGLRVVRLKGGDPYLFGRGAEELIHLARRGVRAEVIPGITSGLAAPMAAGIPVTYRGVASTVTFVTGHEDPGKDRLAVDYAALAQLAAAGGTLCFYMGVGRLHAIARQLTEHGLGPDTPAAAVQWGTRPTQRTARATLATLYDAIQRQGLGAPAMIVVGQVAGLDEPGLRFFTDRPLFGRRVLVTRTRQQASRFSALLAEAGAQPIEAPTIETVEPETWEPIDQALTSLGAYDWLTLTSAQAVAAIAGRLDRLGGDARWFAGLRLAAVGPATADALRDQLGLRADLVADSPSGPGIARAMIEHEPLTGAAVLLLRADIARPDLPRLLSEAGATVTEHAIYRTRRVGRLNPEAAEAVRQGEVDWAAFTSSSTAQNLVDLLAGDAGRLKDLRIASIGPQTTATLRRLGLEPAAEAGSPSIDALVQAIIDAEQAARATP